VGKVALGIVGAIAVGVVVGAIVAGTGGAALAAVPVIAKIGITAKGIGIAGGAITALAGGAASVKKGINESKSGEEYSAWDYLANSLGVSLRTGAVVLASTVAIAYLPAAVFNTTIGTGLILGKGAMPVASVLTKIGGTSAIGFFSLSNLSDVYHSIFGKNPLMDTLFKGNEEAYRTAQFASTLGTMGVMQLGAPIAGNNNRGTKGSVADANFAQSRIRADETFSPQGIKKYSELAGRPIKTVDDLATAIRNGNIKPSQVTVDYVVTADGNKLILNTRTSVALDRAGIPKADWYGIDQTGIQVPDMPKGITFDSLAQQQLANNKLPPSGTPNIPRR